MGSIARTTEQVTYIIMDTTTVEYLAIGSMMNKTSLTMRGIYPTESRAAVLNDYQLYFGMANGFAAARKKPSSELHGVVHRITSKELEVLDRIEAWYIRELVDVVPYQGNKMLPTVKANVYVFDPKKVEINPEQYAENPPEERYLEILMEGAKHFGLDKTFVKNNLENVKFVPRKCLSELRIFELPDHPLPSSSFQKMQEKDKENVDIVFLALKNKILRFDLTGVRSAHTFILKRDRGTRWGYEIASKYMYDPQFGVPAHVQDMTDDHYKYLEDMVLDSLIIGEVNTSWTVVALLEM